MASTQEVVSGFAEVPLWDGSGDQYAQTQVLSGSSAGQRLSRDGDMDGFGHLCLQSLAAEMKNGGETCSFSEMKGWMRLLGP